jgi:mannan endo-1,4-beta-mannosidase
MREIGRCSDSSGCYRFEMRAFVFALPIVATIAFVACGSNDDGEQNDGDAGNIGNNDGSPGNEAGSATDGSTPTDGGTTPGSFCATTNTSPTNDAAVVFDIDLGKGPEQATQDAGPNALASPLAVSPYIYGINNYPENNYFLSYDKTQFGMMRWGGDSYSAWNWTTNNTNGGNDDGFTNTNQFMPFAYGNDPTDPAYNGNPHDTNQAGGVVDGTDSVPAAQTRGMATLVTVSLQDYVAANDSEKTVTYAPSSDFVTNKSTTASGGGAVYQDAFATFMASHYSAAPLFFSLDNEPNYWRTTHPETFGSNDLSFDELVNRGGDFALAVKNAAPSSKVFGPVVSGPDGFTSLDDYDDLASSNPYAKTGVEAIDYYLAGMSTKSTAAGKRLLDVLDLHYYNDSVGKAGTAKTADQCVQGPRDFWDPTYSTPDDAYDDYITGYKPRVMIPRMTSKIEKNYPGTLLAFTEYNDGCEDSIAGGVAEADILGIFGEYGVFAATAWPLKDASPGKNWLLGAFGAYRNYDGTGKTVGSLAVNAKTSDPTSTSVHAFAHSGGAAGVELVLINKTNAAITSTVRISNACALTSAKTYQLTSASAAMASGGPITITNDAFTYSLPAMSVTTVELR